MRCASSSRASILGAILLAFGTLVFAQENPDLDRIRDEITRLKKRQDVLRREQRTAEQELEATELELGIQTRELEIALVARAKLERERSAIEAEISALTPRIEKQKKDLGRRLVALYRLGPLSYLRMVMSLGEQTDPSAAMSMLSYLVTHDGRMIERFQEAQQQLALRVAELVERERKLAEATKLIEDQRRAIAKVREEKERILAALRREESGSEKQIADLEEKARRLERLVDVLSRQSGGMIPALDVRTFRGALAWPAEGKVIEKFGRQRNAKFATYTMNNGLKIGAPPRAAVRAVFQGTVLFSQWFKGYGNLIILDHGNRVFSLYGNLTGPSVAVGDRIATGQSIAGVGESDDAKSGFLYFEIREDNRPEDPQKWLR